MPAPEKVAAVEDVAENLSSHNATLVTDFRGLSVGALAELRAALRENSATYRVVKNTLTKRAAEQAGIEGLQDYLVGPTALVFCEQDPVGPAKVITKFQEDHPELQVKAGWFEGKLLDQAATLKLAELETREELLSRLAGMMDNALAGFARLMQAAATDMLQAMKALADEGGPGAKGFGPDDEPEAASDEDEEPEAEADEEPEAASDEDEEPEAEADEEPEAASDEDDEPEAESDDEPEAASDEDDADDADDDS